MKNKTIEELFDKVTPENFQSFVGFCQDNWKGKQGERLNVTLGFRLEHLNKDGRVLKTKVGKLQFKVE